MAAPTRADIAYFGCLNPTPTNDTDPLGGAIQDGGAELDPEVAGNLWSTLSIGASDVSYYSVHYRKAINTSSGSLQQARFYNRASCKLNTGAGVASIQSNKSTEDITVRAVGKVGGEWNTEELDVVGSSIVLGSTIWDANTVYRWECTAGTPIGLLSCSVNGELVGIIYGTSDDPDDGNSETISCYMISAETQWALADAINENRDSADRLTAPADLTAFSRATYWSGGDASISVPGGELQIDDYIAVIGRLDVIANIPQPLRDFMVRPTILGDSQA